MSQRRGWSGRSEGAVTEQRVQRRLAAILAADVVGYSALMQRAEEATYAEFIWRRDQHRCPARRGRRSGWHPDFRKGVQRSRRQAGLWLRGPGRTAAQEHLQA